MKLFKKNINKDNDKQTVEHINTTYTNEWMDIKKFMNRRRWKKNVDSRFIACIKRNNGTWDFVGIITLKDHFRYNGYSYIIDGRYMSHSASFGTKIIFYHENITLPINIHIDEAQIKDTVNNNTNIRSKVAISPKILDSFMLSNVVEKVIRSDQEIDNQMKKVMLFSFISMLLSGATVLLVLYFNN